jgi:Tfp pilus assembly protein PilF
MKRIVLFLFLTCAGCSTLLAQDSSSTSLYETGKAFMRKGDLDNAIMVLNRAMQQNPSNLEIQKDLAYTYYLRKDYRNAMDIGKQLVERADADVPCYQILGLTYRAIADYNECEKLYKKALKKFPNSGMLYADFGELLASQHKLDEAIKYWEKGIQTDPNNGNNYLNAAHYYDSKGNMLWAVLYGEIFVNIESLSDRTVSMKNMLVDDYKQLLSSPAMLDNYTRNGSPFTRAVATTLLKYLNLTQEGVTTESLTAIRTRFVLDWFNEHANQFAFRLFDHQRQLLQEGSFNAYNQWLFAPAFSPAAYDHWVETHAEENNNFVKLQRSKVFKIPAGQYYPH